MKKPQCVCCRDRGFFEYCLSGGDCYCECVMGKVLEGLETMIPERPSHCARVSREKQIEGLKACNKLEEIEKTKEDNGNSLTNVTIEIKEITILLTDGPDYITFKTNLPSPFPIMGYEANLKLESQAGFGEEYCRVNFPNVPVKIINVRPAKILNR